MISDTDPRRVDLTGDDIVRMSHACLSAMASIVFLWAPPMTFGACFAFCAALLVAASISAVVLVRVRARFSTGPRPSWPPIAMVEWLEATVLAFGVLCLWARGASMLYLVALCFCGLTYSSWRIRAESSVADGWLWRNMATQGWRTLTRNAEPRGYRVPPPPMSRFALGAGNTVLTTSMTCGLLRNIALGAGVATLGLTVFDLQHQALLLAVYLLPLVGAMSLVYQRTWGGVVALDSRAAFLIFCQTLALALVWTLLAGPSADLGERLAIVPPLCLRALLLDRSLLHIRIKGTVSPQVVVTGAVRALCLPFLSAVLSGSTGQIGLAAASSSAVRLGLAPKLPSEVIRFQGRRDSVMRRW